MSVEMTLSDTNTDSYKYIIAIGTKVTYTKFILDTITLCGMFLVCSRHFSKHNYSQTPVSEKYLPGVII